MINKILHSGHSATQTFDVWFWVMVAILAIVAIYIIAKAVIHLFTVDVNYDELDKVSDKCPSCDANLYIERSDFVDVYRCANCRFEGPKDPISVFIDKVKQWITTN